MNAFFGRFLSIVLLAVSPKHENQRHLKQLEYDKKEHLHMSLFQNVVVINERKFVYPTGQNMMTALWHNALTPCSCDFKNATSTAVFINLECLERSRVIICEWSNENKHLLDYVNQEPTRDTLKVARFCLPLFYPSNARVQVK